MVSKFSRCAKSVYLNAQINYMTSVKTLQLGTTIITIKQSNIIPSYLYMRIALHSYVYKSIFKVRFKSYFKFVKMFIIWAIKILNYGHILILSRD